MQGDHDRARAGPSSSSPSLSSSLYVPEDVPDVYRSLLPLADVITPNAFEADFHRMAGLVPLAGAADVVQLRESAA